MKNFNKPITTSNFLTNFYKISTSRNFSSTDLDELFGEFPEDMTAVMEIMRNITENTVSAETTGE
jgi:hypothetical protein